jgi:ABC-type Fe3+/spermidine/putrescine transport system ATPase subunit
MAYVLNELKGASISLRNLSKLYGKVRAVDNANLDIEAGEFVTLLGPSGSGKTTTLMMIAGFVIPTMGDILIDGTSIVSTPAYQRNLGMVFQHYSLFPHMNVYQNIAFPLEMRRMNRGEVGDRVNAALDLVRLSGYQHRRLNQLSGGQQQRIALARALVYEPYVLLLDEPLGALDLKLRQELQIELLHLHERLGVTIISVTHDQGEALSMSDRIVVMASGAIQQVGTSMALYKRPANRFVADFIGESNFISGNSRFDGTAFHLESEDGLKFVGVGSEENSNLEQVTAMVRPECIVLSGEPGGLANVFDGEVRELVYLGDVVKYVIQIGDDTSVTAKWLLRASTGVLKLGDKVRIGWAAEDMVVVQGEEPDR